MNWLVDAIAKRYYLEGEFDLSHGGRDSNYIDLWPLLLNRSLVTWVAGDIVRATKDLNYGTVGGPAMAAIPIAGAIMFAGGVLGRRIDKVFMVRECAKPYGTKKQVEGNLCEGDRVLVVEDVASTGASIAGAISAVLSLGATVEGALTIVDRHEGACELLTREFGISLRSLTTLQDVRRYREANSSVV